MTKLESLPRPTTRNCCWINQKTGEPCTHNAEWWIVSGASPDDTTDSCTEHVGDMLTDAPEIHVYPIMGDAARHRVIDKLIEFRQSHQAMLDLSGLEH